ncbi:DUF481 domain-containing protein [Chryseobacterium salviniae]|uniref:DUF481 domain-containing protein n=1 Tax=Chryseobacterium salviniae TaxID=3101750 RepID=A0ABU6HM88_9FLAO|nr:DUF481 domain-containing protein [Chryseobacterium sp. T9W2-O]MEC3874171.1 DUF481 domain-containing protein [Chryseobacterium sp. T9W2-O]
MAKKYTIVMFFLLGMGKSFAQLNESDTLKFQMRASATGSWQEGNVNILVLRGRLDFVANGNKDWVFKSQNSSLYQELGNKKADNDIYSRNYLYYKPQKKIYPFAIFYAQTNFRRKIDYRLFGGVGATYQAVRTENHMVKLSASLVNEKTSFTTDKFNETAYNGSNEIALWRGTAYLSGIHKIAKNKLRIFYNAYWQPAFENVPNNRVQAEIGLEVPVWKGLNLSTQYVYAHEQVVAEKIKQTDKILTFGVSYQLKK